MRFQTAQFETEPFEGSVLLLLTLYPYFIAHTLYPMTLSVIDAHTHIHFPEFESDREVVIERARKEGIGMITVGTDIETTRQAIEVAQKYEGIWATAGLHPHEAKQFTSLDALHQTIEKLEELAQEEKVVGIGECGIDLFRQDDKDALEMQKKLFVAQLEIAHRIHKPIIIHSRGSQNGNTDGLEMILLILKENQSLLEGEHVCHFFTGTKEIADQFMKFGFSFTFGGLITFNREFDDVIKYIPREKIMVETDAPFVAPASHRGQRNEPSYISETLNSIAHIRGEDEKIVREALLANTKRVFNITTS